jgi:hypothetical protein
MCRAYLHRNCSSYDLPQERTDRAVWGGFSLGQVMTRPLSSGQRKKQKYSMK